MRRCHHSAISGHLSSWTSRSARRKLLKTNRGMFVTPARPAELTQTRLQFMSPVLHINPPAGRLCIFAGKSYRTFPQNDFGRQVKAFAHSRFSFPTVFITRSTPDTKRSDCIAAGHIRQIAHSPGVPIRQCAIGKVVWILPRLR